MAIWRQQAGAFEDVAAHRLELVNLTGPPNPEQIGAARVSVEFFRLFGARAALGRTFIPDEDRPHGPDVVILSSELWRRRFASDSQIVGATIPLNGVAHVVVGVLAAGFDSEQFDRRPDVWIPFQIDFNRQQDGGDLFQVTGRLKPGVTVTAARAQLALATNQNAETNRSGFGVTLEPLRQSMARTVAPSLAVLAGAVALVLLIACANAANLVLTRASARNREIAIRAALGAGRGRVVRQLLTESLVLAALAGVLGLALGIVSIRAVLAIYLGDTSFFAVANPITLPRLGINTAGLTVNVHVIAFSIMLVVSTCVLSGLVPALQTSRTDLTESLKAGTKRVSMRFQRMRSASVLIIIELALAVVLLIGSGLLIRTLLSLTRIDPGFDARNVQTVRMSLTRSPFETRSGLDGLTREGARRVAALPGVVSVAATCCVPLESVWQLPFVIEGRPLPRPVGRLIFHGMVGWTFVSPGYFSVFKIPLLRGRRFTEHADGRAPGVVIINEAMARRFWGTADPLNERLIVGRGMRPEYDADPVRQIIGVVGNVRDQALNRAARPAMYVPMAQVPDGVNVVNLRLLPIAWVIRMNHDPPSLGPIVEHELQKASSGLPTSEARAMTDVVAQSIARDRFSMTLMTIFGAMALLLAAVGVYGLMTYTVQQLTHDIGVRLALGAEAARVRNTVVFEGLRLALIGATIGLALAFGLTRLLASFLFGVNPRDPGVFVVAPAVLALVALAAVWLPARHATRVDPLVALRCE